MLNTKQEKDNKVENGKSFKICDNIILKPSLLCGSWTLRRALGFTARSAFAALHCSWEPEMFYLQCLCLRSSICTLCCHTAPSGAASTAQPFRLGGFSHAVHLLLTNNSSTSILKSTHHAPSRQIAIKLVATDKGSKQLMIESIQAPGFMFSPKIRRGCVKNKTHEPLVKYMLLLPVYLFMSNCLRRYKYHNI